MRWWIGGLAVLLGCGRLRFDPLGTTDGRADDGVPTSGSTSVQRGEYAMGVTPVVASFTPVDPARTIVVCDYRTMSSVHSRMTMCELTGPTTVELSIGRADPGVVASVQVIELPAGNKVQRGRVTFAAAELQRIVAIEPVQLDRAFALISRRTPHEQTDLDDQLATIAAISDPAQLDLARASAGTATFDVAWQVIELSGSTVQAGFTMLPDGSRSMSETIAAVDPARTFVVHNTWGGSLYEEDTYAHVELLGPTTIYFERNSPTTSLLAAWFVVSVPGAIVQHGTVDPVDEATLVRPLDAVEPSRSSVFVSASGGRANDFDNVDSIVVTPALDATTVSFTRADTLDVRGTVSWFVVQWP